MTYLTLKKRQTALHYPASQQESSFQSLNRYLVDFLNLSLVTKQAHWNIQGQNFISIHEMLDDFYEMLQKYSDIFAERLVQLNFVALGTAEFLVQNTSFDPYPSETADVDLHLKALIKRYAQTSNAMRADIDEGLADALTIDYYTQAAEELEKAVWFMEAHLN